MQSNLATSCSLPRGAKVVSAGRGGSALLIPLISRERPGKVGVKHFNLLTSLGLKKTLRIRFGGVGRHLETNFKM